MQWIAGGRSAMGAAHARSGSPNQDAIAWWPADDPGLRTVLAVADGHGAPIHFRSGVGAHIAVETVIEVLTHALGDPRPSAGAARASAIGAAVVAGWRRRVLDHASAHANEPRAARLGDPFLPYGSTLVAAVAGPEGVIVLQIGDGDLVIGCADGAVLRPLPPDRGLVGEQTYSLCQPDAEARMRVRVLAASEADVDFVMLSTDGLAKSFASDRAFLDHAASWRRLLILHGLAGVSERLGPWLSSASLYGSGDDMTLGFMLRAQPPAGPLIASRLLGRAAAASQALPRSLSAAARKSGRVAGILLSASALVAALAAGFLLARWLG